MAESTQDNANSLPAIVTFLPELDIELAEARANGRYISHTFEGWHPDPFELAAAGEVVTEAWQHGTGAAAEKALGDDRATWYHSVETAGLNVMALRRMGYDNPVTLRIAAEAALWHDVGKADEFVHLIAYSGRRLSGDDRMILNMHPIISAWQAYDAHADPRVVVAALFHHGLIADQDDTEPYPKRLPSKLSELVGEVMLRYPEMPEIIASLAIADHFSAVAEEGEARSYRSHPHIDPAERLDQVARQLAHSPRPTGLNVPREVRVAFHELAGVPLAA